MKKHQQQALDELRASGHAVIVWTPKELKGVDPRRVEDRGIELTSDVIDILKD